MTSVCPATDLINIAAYWVFALGIVTLILGRIGKRMTFRQVAPAGCLLILAGIMMNMVI